MLPLDVSNSRGNGGLDMTVFWEMVYIINFIFLTILIPFAIFFYESDDQLTFRKRMCSAICYTLAAFIIFALIFFISYAYLRYAEIPVQVYSSAPALFQNSAVPFNSTQYYALMTPSLVTSAVSVPLYSKTSQTLEIPCSFPIYIMAFMSFFGWFLLVLFGGIGLSALPIDMIRSYKYRPRYRDAKDLMAKHRELKDKTALLLAKGEEIEQAAKDADGVKGFFSKRSAKGKANSELNKFKAAVVSLELEFDLFKLEKNYKDTNPLVWLLKCIFGMVFICVSVIWWIHILVFMVIKPNGVPLNLFLNQVFIGLEQSNAQFIAVAIFAFFNLYLLWAATKGNFKFGIRIPFCCAIHPMKVNDTLMNSFLFNVWLILICSISVTQFCSEAFSQYTRLTSISVLFGTQVKYMKFFKYFYTNNVFPIALLVWSAVSAVCLCICPADKPKILQEIELKAKQMKQT